MTSRAQASPRGVRLTTRAGLLALVVAILLMLSIAPIREFLSQRARIAELQHQTIVLEEATGELRGRVARLHDPGELERIARACLGMVEPGETAFVTVPEHGDSVPPRC